MVLWLAMGVWAVLAAAARPAPASADGFCPFCGTALAPEFGFCPKCGKAVPQAS